MQCEERYAANPTSAKTLNAQARDASLIPKLFHDDEVFV